MKTDVACLLALFLDPGAALALEAPQLKDPMTVVIARSAAPHCEPDCAEWISAEGQFAPGVDAAFAGACGQWASVDCQSSSILLAAQLRWRSGLVT